MLGWPLPREEIVLRRMSWARGAAFFVIEQAAHADGPERRDMLLQRQKRATGMAVANRWDAIARKGTSPAAKSMESLDHSR